MMRTFVWTVLLTKTIIKMYSDYISDDKSIRDVLQHGEMMFK